MSSDTGKSSGRRVPDELRRRTLVSCDRCKTRRIRCIRQNDDQSCKNCRDHGIACQSTLPRKKRLYGSAESLSVRYRTVDALLKGLFPDEDLDDIQTIHRLATERGISLLNVDDTLVGSDAFDAMNPSLDKNADSTTSLEWPFNIDQNIQGTVTQLTEESCIPAPHGVAHYVGPASSFEFANAIRQLVRKRSNVPDQWTAIQDRKSKLRAEFAELPVSIAMEPRIDAHPASSIRDEATDHGSGGPPSTQTSPAHAQSEILTGEIPRSPQSQREWIHSLLPPQRLCDKLVDTFFERVHPNYVLFHRGTFQVRYESIWRRNAQLKLETEIGWLCSLLMVLVFGAQSAEESSLETATSLQRQFLRFVRGHFQHLILTASLVNVQTLLLLQLYEHNAGERNTAWMLLGQATRMAIALGMHRSGTEHHFDSIERNTRRIVWYTLYSFEQYSALTLGRPTAIKALEVNVNLPNDTILDGGNFPPKYLRHASVLLTLTSKARHFATAASPNCFNMATLMSLQDSTKTLLKELRLWKNNLPKHLRPDWAFMIPRNHRAVILLQINYHHLLSIITRPYLLCRIDLEIGSCKTDHDFDTSTDINPSIISFSEECLAAARTVAELLRQLSSRSLLESSVWLDFFYLYHSMLILSLEFLGRPRTTPNENNLDGEKSKSLVSSMIDMCQTNKLAPTFHILCQLSIRFARIVGLPRDDGPSRDEEVQDVDPRTSENPEHQHDSILPEQMISFPHNSNMDLDNFFGFFPEPIADMNHIFSNDMWWDLNNIAGAPMFDISANSQNDTFSSLPGNSQRTSNGRQRG